MGGSVILPAAISSSEMDKGLREIDVTCGGTIEPRPSPSWLKYELTSRPRLAAKLTSVYLESTVSNSLSIGGSIIVVRRSAITRPTLVVLHRRAAGNCPLYR